MRNARRVPTSLACAIAIAVAACGGGGASGGARSAEDVATDASDRTRIRTVIEALGREVGHPTDVEVDAAIVEDKALVSARVAEVIEGLTRQIGWTNPRSPLACRSACSPYTSLALSLDTPSIWAAVRKVHVRYEAQDSRPVDFDASTGVLMFRIPPPRSIDSAGAHTPNAEAAVFRSVLGPKFRNRPLATLGPPELPAYVLYLGTPHDRSETARNVVPLAYAYPRLSGPAQSLARELLVGARTFMDGMDGPTYGSPELENAWALWFRTYSGTLDPKSLLDAASVVFHRERRELPGLRPLDYGLSLVVAQAQNRGTSESAVLTCTNHEHCSTPFWDYLVDPRHPERRQQLAAFLLTSQSSALVEFVALRFFEQRDANMREFLVALERDPAAWSGAFRAALVSVNAVDDELVADTWQRNPALRSPMLRVIDQAATAPSNALAGPSSSKSSSRAQEHASRAFQVLIHRQCRTPARAEFVKLASQNVPAWRQRISRCEAVD